jgi:hypothetical protein
VVDPRARASRRADLAIRLDRCLCRANEHSQKVQVLEDACGRVLCCSASAEWSCAQHYIVGDDGSGGAFYIWPSKEAAQRGHNAEWFANIKARTGSVPTIRYFDLMMIVDNEAGLVTEFPQNMTSEAAE